MTKIRRLFLFKVMFVSMMLIGYSCSKENTDPCADEYLGEYNLLDNARSSIPYNEDLLIYYVDSLGSEVVFEFKIDNKGYSPVDIFLSLPWCDSDSSSGKEYSASGDNYSYYLDEQPQTLGIEFNLRLGVDLSYYEGVMISDMLLINMVYREDINTSANYLKHIVNPRQSSDEYLAEYPEPVDKVTLLDKTFNEVYINGHSTIFYNYEVGLIAFRDTNNKLWVFEKMELKDK